jgi:hypothetical protein
MAAGGGTRGSPDVAHGFGDHVHLARPQINLEVHIADVVSLLNAEELEHPVRVGHSYAGIVITGCRGPAARSTWRRRLARWLPGSGRDRDRRRAVIRAVGVAGGATFAGAVTAGEGPRKPVGSDSWYARRTAAVTSSRRSAPTLRNPMDYKVTLARERSDDRLSSAGLRRYLSRSRLRVPAGKAVVYVLRLALRARKTLGYGPPVAIHAEPAGSALRPSDRRRLLRQVAEAAPYHAIGILENARTRWFNPAAMLLSLLLGRIPGRRRASEHPSQPTWRMDFATP